MINSNNSTENYDALFREAMHSAVISYVGDFIADGKIHRFSTKNRHKKNGWYVFYGMAGAFGDWAQGISEKWSILNDSKRSFSPQEKAKIQQQIKQAEKTADEELLRKQEETATEAAQLWQNGSESGTSEYLTIKQVEAYGVRYSADYWGNFVAVPLRDTDGKLWNIQKIYAPNPDKNNKWFLEGGRKKRCFHLIGTIEKNKIICIGEGYATMASVHRATGNPCAVAFDTSNISVVIEALKSAYTENSILVCGDEDCWQPQIGNNGRKYAEAAAQKHGCSVVFPLFQSEHHPKKPTDFNDLHCLEGLGEVKNQIQLLNSLNDPVGYLVNPWKDLDKENECSDYTDTYPGDSYEIDDWTSDYPKTEALQQGMQKEHGSHILIQDAKSDHNSQKSKVSKEKILETEEESAPSKKNDIGIIDFLNIEINQRKMILAPILPEKGLVMLYAPRGMGKTWVSAEIAYTASSGGDMFGGKWACEDPQKVLFVDGEMPASVLQERFSCIAISRKDASSPTNELLRILASDLLENGIPDLSTQKGQDFIEPHLEGVNLLILDNISALCRSGRENESESWTSMQEWLLSLRRRGLSVLLIHHAGKGGNQRGNSKKEDLLDTVIALKRPNTYEPKQGARFEVHYEKARGFYGEEAEPFEVQRKKDSFGHSFWEVKGMEDVQLNQILDLHKDGVTQRDIAKQVGVGVATINRTLQKARAEGGI